MKQKTKLVSACILLLTLVSVVMATSYYIYSNTVMVTSYSLALTYNINSVIEHKINVTLTAIISQ